MTHPKILKAERFGCLGNKAKRDLFCFGCNCIMDLDCEEYVFDIFGRIFCSEGCLMEYFYKRLEGF